MSREACEPGLREVRARGEANKERASGRGTYFGMICVAFFLSLEMAEGKASVSSSRANGQWLNPTADSLALG